MAISFLSNSLMSHRCKNRWDHNQSNYRKVRFSEIFHPNIGYPTNVYLYLSLIPYMEHFLSFYVDSITNLERAKIPCIPHGLIDRNEILVT